MHRCSELKSTQTLSDLFQTQSTPKSTSTVCACVFMRVHLSSCVCAYRTESNGQQRCPALLLVFRVSQEPKAGWSSNPQDLPISASSILKSGPRGQALLQPPSLPPHPTMHFCFSEKETEAEGSESHASTQSGGITGTGLCPSHLTQGQAEEDHRTHR